VGSGPVYTGPGRGTAPCGTCRLPFRGRAAAAAVVEESAKPDAEPCKNGNEEPGCDAQPSPPRPLARLLDEGRQPLARPVWPCGAKEPASAGFAHGCERWGGEARI